MAKINTLPLNPLLVQPLSPGKRLLDIVGASVGLIVLSPLFLLIALFIKTVSPGPVFFKQQRIGAGGKPFLFWKFRTMRVNADTHVHQKYLAELIKSSESSGGPGKPMNKLENDPRVIPLGKYLRKSCLDELPQLINVLRGEMSLVGPRPPIPYEVQEYAMWHKERLDIVPGMTGLWQVSGKNRLSFTEMLRLDIRYMNKANVWTDLKILFKTPAAI
ncbi:MAG TPA: sugar transferase, partial [bacterium]|nr:sugar transferase [bacterium]